MGKKTTKTRSVDLFSSRGVITVILNLLTDCSVRATWSRPSNTSGRDRDADFSADVQSPEFLGISLPGNAQPFRDAGFRISSYRKKYIHEYPLPTYDINSSAKVVGVCPRSPTSLRAWILGVYECGGIVRGLRGSSRVRIIFNEKHPSSLSLSLSFFFVRAIRHLGTFPASDVASETPMTPAAKRNLSAKNAEHISAGQMYTSTGAVENPSKVVA